MLQRNMLSEHQIVEHKEFNIITTDNKELYSQCWLTGPHALGCIVLVHGLGEHSSRYIEWAKKFTDNGFSVFSFDLRGHGKSMSKAKKASNYEKILEDIGLVIEKSKEVCPNQPIFLYGHSLGGNLVANYIISNPINIKGVILTSPWLELTQPPSGIMRAVAKLLSLVAPNLQVNNGLKSEDLSKELREVHLYRKDPLVHNKIPVRLFVQAYAKGMLAKRCIYKINVPLLVLHGTADNITSYQASQDFVMNASEKTNFYKIEGGYHELHNDTDSKKTFQIILNWLKDSI